MPVWSYVICVLCILVYAKQYSNERDIYQDAARYCNINASPSVGIAANELIFNQASSYCADWLSAIYINGLEEEYIAEWESTIWEVPVTQEQAQLKKIETLKKFYNGFEWRTSPSFTQKLLYYPDSPNPFRMITSTIAHADPWHLIGNLLFFIAFATFVEIAVGVGRFLLIFFSIAIGENLLYSLTTILSQEAVPTLGLSGVVMGMIGLTAYLAPTIGIKTFVFVKVFVIQAWVLALFYIGWDIYSALTSGMSSGVNLVAHIGGALIGYLIGYFGLHRHKDAVADALRYM